MSGKDVQDTYLQATGKWDGCDWTTSFGQTGLNLEGLHTWQAVLLARATAGPEAADWHAAARWLTQVEVAARCADKEAQNAVALARAEKWPQALLCARKACLIEAGYHARLLWQPLHDAIEAGLAEREQQGSGVDASSPASLTAQLKSN